MGSIGEWLWSLFLFVRGAFFVFYRICHRFYPSPVPFPMLLFFGPGRWFCSFVLFAFFIWVTIWLWADSFFVKEQENGCFFGY